jgi:glutamate carboxypeptidase
MKTEAIEGFDLQVFQSELEWLVNIDSGSRCVEGVNTVTDWFSERFNSINWTVESIHPPHADLGRSALAWTGDRDNLDLLIISHTDTVFPAETAKKRPFRVVEDRYTGPGVADMKAGCLMAWYALRELQMEGRLHGNVAILLNGEHELSCPTIRPFIEKISQCAKVVVTTEPARADGSCVRQRKGILRYKIAFHGKSAHSGVEPEKGHCAVTEMARFIISLKNLEDRERGISVNPGVVSGGTSVNAIPGTAECQLDIRVTELADAYRLDKAVRERTQNPANPDVRISLEGGITRPPMVPNARSEELIHGINQIARNYDIDLHWTFSGGGSDASYASAFGIPALCGLGPVGGNYHTDEEYLEINQLQERMCIFRDMVEAIVKGAL